MIAYLLMVIKCFNVSLHLGLLHWNGTMILERILVWRFMVLCCQNGLWCGCIARRIWNYHIWYSENWLVGSVYVMLQTLSFDILFMWVLGWKSLKPSRKTLQCGCMGLVLPLGMSPKRHGVWLALGWCPRIVIIILIEYLVEHWYLMCRLVGVSTLSVGKGWMRESIDKTSKHMHTCLTWLHILMIIKCLSCMLLYV